MIYVSLTIHVLEDYNLAKGEDNDRDASRVPVEELEHIDPALETHGDATYEEEEAHDAHHQWLLRPQRSELVEHCRRQRLHHRELLTGVQCELHSSY